MILYKLLREYLLDILIDLIRKSSIIFFLFFFSIESSAQESINQIGINADDILPALFSSDANTFNLLYRRKLDDKKHVRLGFKYSYEEQNEFTIGLKPGIDFLFSNSEKWNFSYGFDGALIHTKSFTSERKYYEFAIIPFLRVEFLFGEHFSVSTEPGIFLRLTDVNDTDNSPIDNSYSIFSSGLSGIGYVKFNFSF